MSTTKNGQILLYFHFNKILKGLKLVSSLQDWVRIMSEMFVKQNTSIEPYFILIMLRIQKK